MKWIKPNTITGSVAEGEKYFKRKDVEDKIWHEIANNNHVLFLAPRRVGKSSIVMHMALKNENAFSSKYENIQTDSSLQDFYLRLCKMIYEALTNVGKTKNSLSKWWNKWTITSFGPESMSIGKAELDYRKEFFEMLDNLKQEDKKVVLFLDEFPDVVWNVYKKSGVHDAEQLLDDVRTLRHTQKFKDVFVTVLLGSVGLAHIVKKISGRTDKVNDLHKEYLQALKPTQAKAFLNYLVTDATMQIDEEAQDYLLNKIGHFISYYIQLMVEACDDFLYAIENEKLTILYIDEAYKKLLKKNEHFEDWDDRLSKYFIDKYAYLLDILSKCANKGKLSLQEIYNIAVKHKNTQMWKADLDDILVADGYLFTDDDEQFSFNSPLLKDWWKSRHPLMKK